MNLKEFVWIWMRMSESVEFWGDQTNLSEPERDWVNRSKSVWEGLTLNAASKLVPPHCLAVESLLRISPPSPQSSYPTLVGFIGIFRPLAWPTTICSVTKTVIMFEINHVWDVWLVDAVFRMWFVVWFFAWLLWHGISLECRIAPSRIFRNSGCPRWCRVSIEEYCDFRMWRQVLCVEDKLFLLIMMICMVEYVSKD